MSNLLQNSGTRLPQVMNTTGFHQNVGEGNKSFNAMSLDPYLSEAFGKGSGGARLRQTRLHYPARLRVRVNTSKFRCFAVLMHNMTLV